MQTLNRDKPLILGAGLAGLSAALASPSGAVVVSPAALGEGCASSWAQGGMAAALSPDDSPALHAADTVAAGAGLVDPEMAERLTLDGAEAVSRLAALGAPFDRDADGRFVQSLEAAHSRARVARVTGDQAGAGIMRAVVAAVRARPDIEVIEHARARALVQDAGGRVRGALVERDGAPIEILAPAVVMATGGIGGLYAVTTNPPEARGEGMALAALAGAAVRDPEFVQFHPTALDAGLDPAPLMSEALRGEGARLVDGEGRPFMQAFDPRGDLAARDVVARAIHRRIAAGEGVFLDGREAVGDHFPEHFPTAFKACMAAGIDPRRELIPIAPAAHYHMGGIEADEDGRTSLAGLYAVGECASTGVHGANRLASNSLLEAAVFGARAGRAAAAEQVSASPLRMTAASPELPPEALRALRAAMSRYAGVERDADGLDHLMAVLDRLQGAHGLALPLIAARLVAQGAIDRRESRGAHQRLDHPDLAAPVSTRIRLDQAARMAAE